MAGSAPDPAGSAAWPPPAIPRTAAAITRPHSRFITGMRSPRGHAVACQYDARVSLAILSTIGSIGGAQIRYVVQHFFGGTMYTRRIASVSLSCSSRVGGCLRPAARESGRDSRYAGHWPFAPLKEIDAGLPDQVVYRPADLAALGDTKLGLYVFGNGGCSNDGASARLHLLECRFARLPRDRARRNLQRPRQDRSAAAARGASIQNYAPTRPAQLSAAIDWALAENERSGSRYSAASIPSRSRSPVSAVAAFKR